MKKGDFLVRRWPSRLLMLVLLLLCWVPAPLAFQDDFEEEYLEDEILLFKKEELVAAAARRVVRLSEAPGTITILTAEDLEARGVLTLGQALKHVSSTLLVPQDLSLGLEFRNVRQPFSNKVLLLQDGRILNNVFKGSMSLDLTQPIETIQRIEIVRGPGSALYGANAFGGFINLVSKRGEQVPGLTLSAALDDDGLNYVYASYGRKWGDWDLLLQARTLDTEVWDVVNQDRDDLRDFRINAGLHRKKTSLYFGLYDNRADTPGTFELPTPLDEREGKGWYLDLSHQWNWGVDKKFKVRAYYTDHDFEYRNGFKDINLPEVTPGWVFANALFVVDPDGNILTDPEREDVDARAFANAGDRYIDFSDYLAFLNGTIPSVFSTAHSDESSFLAEVQFDWNSSDRHYFLAGASYKIDRLSNSQIGDHTFRNLAVFVEDEWRFFNDKLILLGSLRWDEHSQFGDKFTPRVSAIWAPNKHFSIKGAWGSAFRSPNFAELFQNRRSDFLEINGNPDLVQEQISTAEIQFSLDFAPKYSASLIFYDYTLDDEVRFRVDRRRVYIQALWNDLGFFPPVPVLVFDPTLAEVPLAATFINANGTEGQGFEAAFRYSPHDNLSFHLSYNRAYNTQTGEEILVETGNIIDPITGEVLPGPPQAGDIPELEPVLLFEEFHNDSLSLGLSYRWQDRLTVDSRVTWLSAPGELVLGDHEEIKYTWDLSVAWHFKRFDLQLTGQNMLGGDYIFDPTSGTFPEMDPSVVFSIRIKELFK